MEQEAPIAADSGRRHRDVPLVVDLDGCLLRTDLLLETALALLRSHPLHALQMLFWIFRGKAYLKARVAQATDIEAARLPFDERLIAFIRAERAAGRQIVLATASDQRLADRVADFLGLFDTVFASDGHTNLSRAAKRDRLVAAFGARGFDYIGNSADDLPVWAVARRILLANPDAGIRRRAAQLGAVAQVWERDAGGPAAWLRAIRLHQWAKNALIFVPLLAAHQGLEPDLLGRAGLAFLAFGLCASGVYLLNDLLDLHDDRHHPTKCRRPFATGALRVGSGLWVAPGLVAAGAALALLALPLPFVVVLGTYTLLSLAYSLWLKRLMAVDILVLALLYTLRIIAGGAATGIELTFWLLGFSIFLFLSLALVKRYGELRQLRAEGDDLQVRGRGYFPDDLEMISSLGAAAGYLSTLVLALYIHEIGASPLYRYPHIIWLACPLLLLWITRVWLLTHRGQMHDDPVVFALKDLPSLAIGFSLVLVFWAAT